MTAERGSTSPVIDRRLPSTSSRGSMSPATYMHLPAASSRLLAGGQRMIIMEQTGVPRPVEEGPPVRHTPKRLELASNNK